jgi:hypothetical protein
MNHVKNRLAKDRTKGNQCKLNLVNKITITFVQQQQSLTEQTMFFGTITATVLNFVNTAVLDDFVLK